MPEKTDLKYIRSMWLQVRNKNFWNHKRDNELPTSTENVV